MTTDPFLLRTEPAAPEPPPPPRRVRLVIVLVGLAVVVTGLIIVLTLLPGWLAGPTIGPRATTAAAGTASEARRIQATLFYLSADGTRLSGTSRSVVLGETPAAQVQRLVEAQVAAPPSGLESTIPPGTTVRAVFVTDANEAYIDLGGTIVTGHAGGSLAEALTVYALVNAITVNLPDISAVQILIDGKEVDSLTGHLDLRAPLTKALDWLEKGQ
jgi:Sporulation and spore germination